MDARAAMEVELDEMEEAALRETLERYAQALELVRGDLSSSLGEGAVEPFLQSSLRQIRGHYPAILDGVELEGGVLEADAVLRNLILLPSVERRDRVAEALNELVYAVLLHVKMKLGVEVERRISDRVARVLQTGD
jgi:hypothetical protein